MKLQSFLISGAMLTVAAFAATAGTFSPGGKWDNLPTSTSGTGCIIPLDINEAKTVSQSIFSFNELAPLAPVTEGTKTTFTTITSVSFPLALLPSYGMVTGTVDITVYLQEYDDITFPKVDSKEQWIPFADAVKGTLTLNTQEGEFAEMLFMGDCNYIATVTFEQPVKYTGKSLVMTTVNNNDIEDDNYQGYFDGGFDFVPGGSNGKTHYRSAYIKNNLTPDGAIGTKLYTVPVVQFGYSTEEVVAGPTISYGDPTTAKIGPYDSPTTGSNSSGAVLPYDNAYTNAFAQAIYTPNELSALLGDDGNQLADITSLTFKLYCDYMMPTGELQFDVYIQNYDDTTFPLDDNDKEQWVAYSKDVKGTWSYEFDYDDLTGVQEYDITFNSPLRYEGNSLLVTWVTSGTFQDLYVNRFESQIFRGTGRQSAVTAEDYDIDDLTGAAKNVSKDLPVLTLGYTPVIISSGKPQVGFDNLTISARRATVDPTQTAFGRISDANSITVEFDVAGYEEGDCYELFLDNVSIGNLNHSHGVISHMYIPTTASRLVIKDINDVKEGSAVTLPVEDFDCLFPAPAVTASDYALQASYTVHEDRSAKVAGVAKFEFSADTGLYAKMRANTEGQVRVLANGDDLPDCFAPFIPRGEYNDYQKNKALSLYNLMLTSTPVSHGRLTDEADNISATIAGKFSLEYPLISQNPPVLGDALASDVEYDFVSDTNRTLSKIERIYDNGESASYLRGQAKATLKVDDDHSLTVDTEHPLKFVYIHDVENGYMDFFVQKENQIHYCHDTSVLTNRSNITVTEGDTPSGDTSREWINTESNILSFPRQPGNLYIRNVTPSGQVLNDFTYECNPDGTVTAITAVEAAANAAPALYYNLQGQPVATPAAPGIYLRRQGTTVTKVNVK